MKVYIYIFFVITSLKVMSCSCGSIDEQNRQEWIDEADIVVEGCFEEVLSIEPSEGLNQLKNSGSNILFRVTKVFKGPLDLNLIAILQLDGFCTKRFWEGSSYILLGRRIEEVLCYEPEDYDEVPPPPPSIETEPGQIAIWGCEERGYWNSITTNYYTIQTGLCMSFDSKSITGRLIKNGF